MDTLVICPSCEKLNRVPVASSAKEKPVCGNCKAELPVLSGVQSLNGKTFAPLITKTSRPVLVDFWAPWCGPCVSFAPTFSGAAVEFGGKIIFAKVNTEAEQSLGAQQKIKSIPTLILFRDGREIARQSGALTSIQLRQFLGAHHSV